MKPETGPDSQRVLQVIGEFSSRQDEIVLFWDDYRRDSPYRRLTVVVGDTVAELNIQYSTKINEDVIQIDYEDIELVNVNWKDQVFPGEGIVVISGSVSVIRRDGVTPTLLDPIISRLNKSIALRTFIDSKCKHSISNDRISSSNSVNLELLRRRYLGIERRILPGKTVSDGCEAYIFNELRSEVVIARFRVNRCKIYFGYIHRRHREVSTYRGKR